MKEWTKERVEALSPNDRAKVYANALKAGNSEGDALAELIRNSGLSLMDGSGITRDHPLVMGMDAIINSEEGKAACVKAVEDDWPALAGVDPMLAEEFPTDYGKHNQTTDWAGHLVADLMRDLGYKKLEKQGKTPEGCVAKTGELWEKPDKGDKFLWKAGDLTRLK